MEGRVLIAREVLAATPARATGIPGPRKVPRMIFSSASRSGATAFVARLCRWQRRLSAPAMGRLFVLAPGLAVVTFVARLIRGRERAPPFVK